MARKLIIIVMIVIGVVTGWLVTLYCAYQQGRKDVLRTDLKIYYVNRTTHRDSIGSNRELREFLKGRYYSIAAEVPNDLLSAHLINLGPITNDILGRLVNRKGGESPASLYGSFYNRIQKQALNLDGLTIIGPAVTPSNRENSLLATNASSK